MLLNRSTTISVCFFAMISALVPFPSGAQVSTASLFNTQAVDNPAALITVPPISSIYFQTLSGTGVFNQGLLEREKYSLTESRALATYRNESFGLQLQFLPKQTRTVDEVTQYSRASAIVEETGFRLNYSGRLFDSLNLGLGYENKKRKIGSSTATANGLLGGVIVLLPYDLNLGLAAKLVSSTADTEDSRSWIEQQIGIGWMSRTYDWQMRIDLALNKSPKVYQAASSADKGGNYQRQWSQNRINVEASYKFSFVNWALGLEQRSRTYAALEDGIEEDETEQNIYLGLLFWEDRLGLFAGQSKILNVLSRHEHSDTLNHMSAVLSF